VAEPREFQRGHSVSRMLKHLPNLLTGLRLAAAPALALLLLPAPIARRSACSPSRD